MSEYNLPNGSKVDNGRSVQPANDTAPTTSRKRTIVPRLPKIEPKKPPEKAEFSDIFTKTDINGFPDWYEAPNWSMKIAWTIILLAAITLLTLELVHTIRDFIDNPILTTYSLVNKPDGMKFPEVYLCPTNPIHRLQYTTLKVDGEWEEKHADGLLKALSNVTGLAGLLQAKTNLNELLAANRPTPAHGGAGGPGSGLTTKRPRYIEPAVLWIPEKIEEYFKAVGYPQRTFIRECSFNGKPINCTDVITEVFDVDYGKCFLIKLNKYQSVGGVGLSLVLDLDFMNGYPEQAKPQPFSDGVLLKVGEKVDPSTSGSIQLMPSTYSKVALSSRKMSLIDRSRLKESASQLCTDDKDASEKLKILKGDFFTMDSCIQDCHQVHVVENCSCYLPVDRRFINDHILTKENMDICTPKMLKTCVTDIFKEKKKVIEECTRGCNLPCNYWEYQMSLSASAFPTHALKNVNEYGLDELKLDETEFLHRAHFCSGPLYPPTRTQRSECPTPFTESTLPTPLISPNATDDGESLPLPPGTDQPEITIEPNSTALWYWNQTEEDCLSREFRWCPELDYDPADNLRFSPGSYFLTRTLCLNNCGYGNPCLALDNTPNDPYDVTPPKRKDGSDRRERMRYTWLMDEGRCVRYYGYGIGGATENDFDTRELCEQKCNGSSNDPCNINSPNRCISYYYATNSESDGCIQQTALVPADNCIMTPTGNHYLDFWSCQQNCEALTNDSINCTGPALRADGNCVEVERRYFHEPHLGVCQPFDYIGCPMAKGNAFKTKQECEDTCVKTIVKPSGWKSNIPLTNPTPNEDPKREVIQGASKLNIRPSKWTQGDMIVLDIAFSSLQYIELSQEHSMTFTTFVSNIGGQVGLWIGCSVVTIVKLFLVVMPLCLRCRKKNTNAARAEGRVS